MTKHAERTTPNKSRINVIVLDLDGTLYRQDQTDVLMHFDNRARDYVANLLGVDKTHAMSLVGEFVRSHGTTIKGLIATGATFDEEEFLEYLHDINVDTITENRALRTALQNSQRRLYVYTNGTDTYASRVLKRLGISDVIHGIFGIGQSHYDCKPSQRSLDMFLDYFGLDPRECIFFDDSKDNLRTAYHTGMTTVYIDHAGNCNGEQFIHHTTDDLVDTINTIFDDNALSK